MATLHGILAELGIESPALHPERETPHASRWMVDEDFIPETGRLYELAFGRIPFDGEDRHVLKRVRIAGPTPNEWIDLDEDRPLDRELIGHPVRAFRIIK